mmetsp:Transcript_30239/g.92511  ORF Transcript_30239/g.92511 Transcript_30239/m.92511 type:complete len:110 (-) Transcript_30239:2752-3081(-)
MSSIRIIIGYYETAVFACSDDREEKLSDWRRHEKKVECRKEGQCGWGREKKESIPLVAHEEEKGREEKTFVFLGRSVLEGRRKEPGRSASFFFEAEEEDDDDGGRLVGW